MGHFQQEKTQSGLKTLSVAPVLVAREKMSLLRLNTPLGALMLYVLLVSFYILYFNLKTWIACQIRGESYFV